MLMVWKEEHSKKKTLRLGYRGHTQVDDEASSGLRAAIDSELVSCHLGLLDDY